jgi:hypothetical protein
LHDSKGVPLGINWIPTIGEFDITPDEVKFLGKAVPPQEEPAPHEPESKPAPGLGIALCDRSLADGSISANIEFEAVDEDTTCELLVAYDVDNNHFMNAGLGPESWAMFGIREYRGPRIPNSWFNYRTAGTRTNLKPHRRYHLNADFLGALVTLAIDGVTVASAEVTSPLGKPRPVGLFCKGRAPIHIFNFSVTAVKPKAFVIMQFGGQFDSVYDDVVKEVFKSYEVNVLRADEVSGPGLVIGDIVREISTSQLVIADITPVNANVYFEVGYALALGKPTILLAQKGTALPFDVAGFRVLFYEDTIGGKRKLEEGIAKHITSILSS